MTKTGKPISDEERKSRSIKHLLLYGIKMMVRRDIGGKDAIVNHATKIRDDFLKRENVQNCLDEKYLAETFVGKTAQEGAKLVVELNQRMLKETAATTALILEEQKNGIKARQKRTVDEIERRLEELDDVFIPLLCKIVADQKIADKDGKAKRRPVHGVLSSAEDLQDALHELVSAVGALLRPRLPLSPKQALISISECSNTHVMK